MTSYPSQQNLYPKFIDVSLSYRNRRVFTDFPYKLPSIDGSSAFSLFLSSEKDFLLTFPPQPYPVPSSLYPQPYKK